MSLINDALRRATSEPQKRDEKELPPMQPTFRPIRAGGPGFSIFLVCFALAAALTLGAWIFYKRGMAGANAAATPPKPATTANTNSNPLARASQTLGAVEALNQEGAIAAAGLQATSASEPRSEVKLQGIFYSAKNPSAIINGQTMKVGDESDGIKVVEITQKSVRIESGGQSRELTMK